MKTFKMSHRNQHFYLKLVDYAITCLTSETTNSMQFSDPDDRCGRLSALFSLLRARPADWYCWNCATCHQSGREYSVPLIPLWCINLCATFVHGRGCSASHAIFVLSPCWSFNDLLFVLFHFHTSVAFPYTIEISTFMCGLEKTNLFHVPT